MSMQQRIRPVASLTIAMSVFVGALTACGNAPGASQPSIAASGGNGSAGTVVHLFGIQALTGPSAFGNTSAQQAAELAVKEINDSGGITDAAGHVYTFDINRNDMGTNKAEAIALVRQAASDEKYTAIIGPTNSLGYVPSVPVAAQQRIPIISPGSLAAVEEWNEWAYRVNPTVAIGLAVAIPTVVDKLGAKKIAVIYDQTQDGQKSAANVVQELASKGNFELSTSQAFNSGDQDFSGQLGVISAAHPDLIFVAAQPEDGTRIVSQMRNSGMATPWMASSSDVLGSDYWDASKGASEKGYSWVSINASSSDAKIAKVRDEYRKMFGEGPSGELTDLASYGYTAVYAVAAAIQKAGSADREKVREALSTLETTTPLGTQVTFNNPPTGENLKPTVTVVQITGRGTYESVQ